MILDKIIDDVIKITDQALRENRHNPNISVYIKNSVYYDIHRNLYGKLTSAEYEFVRDKTIVGAKVYRVITDDISYEYKVYCEEV